MSLWKPTPTSLTPEIVISRWTIFLVDHKDLHVVGYNETEQHGRVSSKIVSLDEQTKTVTTRSGRVYKLVGEPGSDLDAMYVWNRWCEINNVTHVDDATYDCWR